MHLIIHDKEVLCIAPDMPSALRTVREIKHSKPNATIVYLPDEQATHYLLEKGRRDWAMNH